MDDSAKGGLTQLWELFTSTLSGRGFSVVRLAGRGEGVTGSDAQNKGYRQPTETELCTNLYRHNSMPDAKNLSVVAFPFWRYDVTNFPSQEGNESSNSDI